MFAYQRIVLSLAADCANPGRMLMIQFFSESVKEHVVKKICGLSQRESGMVTMAEDPVYRAVDNVSETDKGDRPRKWNMSHVCSSSSKKK